MIPNIIHFIFGLQADFGNRPFMPFHYIAIKSAFDVNKPDKIYFICAYEPQSEWFDKCKPFIEIVDKILIAKKADPQADTSEWEKEINEKVYELYGLTEEEKRIIEESNK